jgi:GH43 family beta-xylosidase
MINGNFYLFNTRAIDGTIFTIKDKLYFAYSGWPLGVRNNDLVQCIFLIEMRDAITASGTPLCISKPTYSWEKVRDQNGSHEINEGPQYLEINSFQGLVISCSGSWTSDYKMAVVRYDGGDPMNPLSWIKEKSPLMQMGVSTSGPYGPGHGSFIRSPQGELFCIYHATDNPNDGWNNRKARCRRLGATNEGLPFFGLPYTGRAPIERGQLPPTLPTIGGFQWILTCIGKIFRSREDL